jgi:CPA1 family monovalent cation:H+ antiporter
MALSLPRDMPGREVILAMTYVVVAFSILVQGLTVGPLARRWPAAAGPAPGGTAAPPPPVDGPGDDRA